MKRILGLVLMAWIAAPLTVQAGNWIDWRGPHQNGCSDDTDLPSGWKPDPKDPASNCLWTQPYGGRSTPLVMNGRVYIIDDAGSGVNEQERVMCFDAETGKVLWQHRFNVFYTDIVSARVGWANLAGDLETGNIYAHGVQGMFFCFDKDGKILWQHSLTEEYGRISGYGGRVNSPVVADNLVIMGFLNASWGDQARGNPRFLAFDKRTGVPVYWAHPSDVLHGTYSSVPVVHAINGVSLLITGTSGGEVVAMKVGTGEKVWSYPVSAKALNTSPVIEGTHLFIGHGEENLDTTTQGRVLCLDIGSIENGQPKLVWKVDGIQTKYPSPLYHDGKVYFCDDSARIYCLDAKTGQQIWKYKYGHSANGSPVMADGKIYVGEVKGKFHILKPGPKGCQDLSTVFFRSRDGTSAVEINGSPAIANGRVYFFTSEAIYCIGKKGQPSSFTKALGRFPNQAARKPAHLLVYPADVVLEPGQSTSFKVNAYDDKGELIGEVKAESWSLPAPPPPPGAKSSPPPLKGTITPDGTLTVDKVPPGQGAYVLAKTGGLSAMARVRVVPTLPLHQDFQRIPEGAVPGGWINVAGKFTVVTKDNVRVLKKLSNNPNPLLARALTFFTLPNTTDYTIESDLMGEKKGADMPDMGIAACRYTLFLKGNEQRLVLASWENLPRVNKEIPFEWKPDAWYHIKLSVRPVGPSAQIAGKIWPRDQKEPADWTITFDDPTPNREGSAGLYGYATGNLDKPEGAAIYYANVKVTPNARQSTRHN